jgi:hypothetical protein
LIKWPRRPPGQRLPDAGAPPDDLTGVSFPPTADRHHVPLHLPPLPPAKRCRRRAHRSSVRHWLGPPLTVTLSLPPSILSASRVSAPPVAPAAQRPSWRGPGFRTADRKNITTGRSPVPRSSSRWDTGAWLRAGARTHTTRGFVSAAHAMAKALVRTGSSIFRRKDGTLLQYSSCKHRCSIEGRGMAQT